MEILISISRDGFFFKRYLNRFESKICISYFNYPKPVVLKINYERHRSFHFSRAVLTTHSFFHFKAFHEELISITWDTEVDMLRAKDI
jgi:hypothetical protein